MQVVRQWKTPHKNLDCKVDNSRQARVLSATGKSGREYASFKFENSDTYRVVVVPAVSSYLAGEGVHPRLGTFQKLLGPGTSVRFAPVASVLPAVQPELSSPVRGAERVRLVLHGTSSILKSSCQSVLSSTTPGQIRHPPVGHFFMAPVVSRGKVRTMT